MKFHIAVCATILLCACSEQEAPQQQQAAVAVPDPASLERWLGRWTGPEGTYLEISPDAAGLRVEIANLDGPQAYPGRAVGDHVEFQRNGKTETIRAGNGEDTGMKWLAEKKNCLLVTAGEGWCRD